MAKSAKTQTETKETDPANITWVQVYDAAPNKMFTEEERACVRFLIFNRRIKCAECGKMRRKMWSMLHQFHACTFPTMGFVLETPEHSHLPLTPVCDDHPLGPAFDKDDGITMVHIAEAPPDNKFFTEAQTAWMRFLIFNRAVKCAECGKKRKKMWSLLCQFRAVNSDNAHLPLTPVCGEHALAPAFDKDADAE